MAFTATINDIRRQKDTISVTVIYNDSATTWTIQKIFDFPDDGSVTQASARAEIIRVGTIYKNNLTNNNFLQSQVGTVITI